jgi:hypothetical protein
LLSTALRAVSAQGARRQGPLRASREGDGAAMNRRQRHTLAAFVRQTADEWHPFERITSAEPAFAKFGDVHSCWANNRYGIHVYRRKAILRSGSVALHLNIRRQDGGIDFPWYDLQRIKNEIVGPEYVAIEIFPAESELVDQANARHLFVLPLGEPSPFTIRGRWE